VFSTYERPSAEPLNGRCPAAPTCDFDGITPLWREGAKGLNTGSRRTGRYTREELVLRTGVPHAALRDLNGDSDSDQNGVEQHRPYAAIDVVRLAVVDRLVRSGVPVARAAALVRAAESRVSATV